MFLIVDCCAVDEEIERGIVALLIDFWDANGSSC